jgi:hypothetical protein
MRALALVVFCASAAFADVGQARKDEVAKAAVVIVRGSADAMEQVLGRAKVNFVLVDAAELAELPLHSKQVVMVNCTGDMSDPARERLKRFVHHRPRGRERGAAHLPQHHRVDGRQHEPGSGARAVARQ